jgi:hypothetical protein
VKCWAACLSHGQLGGRLRICHHATLFCSATACLAGQACSSCPSGRFDNPSASWVQVNAALAARALSGQKRGPEAEPDADGAPVRPWGRLSVELSQRASVQPEHGICSWQQ